MPDIFGDANKKRPASVTIRKDLADVYAFFRDLARQPLYVKNIHSSRLLSPSRARWTGGEDGKKSGETEIIQEIPNEILAWRTTGDTQEIGAATFERAVGGRGTVVSLKLAYQGAVNQLLDKAAKLKGSDLETEAASTLMRFKALLETGEVPTVEGQPSGREEASAA